MADLEALVVVPTSNTVTIDSTDDHLFEELERELGN